MPLKPIRRTRPFWKPPLRNTLTAEMRSYVKLEILMKFFKALAVIASALILSACMQVQTQVDAYSSIPADLEPKTIYIAPYKGMSGNSLEWQTNARILAQTLSEKGFSVV